VYEITDSTRKHFGETTTFALATLDCDEKKEGKGTMFQWLPTMYTIRKIRAFRYPLFENLRCFVLLGK
jgi:hypothetical protein